MTTRPDIVLLVLDTQRLDRLSCYGCEFETSPHIDELASDAFADSDFLLNLSFSPLTAPLWQTALSFKGNT